MNFICWTNNGLNPRSIIVVAMIRLLINIHHIYNEQILAMFMLQMENGLIVFVFFNILASFWHKYALSLKLRGFVFCEYCECIQTPTIKYN